MSLWLAIQAIVLGIVEGLTEFLPVSSTGHLIITADLLDFSGPRAVAFNIIIQTGAMLAVVWEYRGKILDVVRGLPREAAAQRFTANLLVAFLPAAVCGVLLSDFLDRYLFNPVTVAIALVVGGLAILWAERRTHRIEVEAVDAMDWTHALKVGCAQCLALIPGTSRSGATIIGGLLFGLSRRAAAEFSFFLAMPTLFGAAVYSGYKARDTIHLDDFALFALGTAAAFVSAMVAVRGLLRFIGHHSFAVFAWYRIGFGLLILATWASGVIDWSDAVA